MKIPVRLRRNASVLLLITIFLSATYWVASPPIVQGISSGVVISQVYGGGGNSGATFKNDFIELFNRGTSAVSVAGWSVQYASSAGITWQVTSLSGSIAPGQYYLVQEAPGAGGTTNLPTPDASGAIPMSATAGKVALVNTTTALTGACPTGASIIDFVGFGTTASCFEGAGPTPAPSNINAVLRAAAGCTETDNNAGDFAAGAPNPRNTSSALNPCVGEAAPGVASTLPTNGATNVAVNASITVNFSEAVNVTGSWFSISGSSSGAHTAAVSGGPTSFTLNPDTDFATSETVTVTVFASQVTDQDVSDPPDNMAADFVFSFTTAAPPPPFKPIHEIQGTTGVSPFNTLMVSTAGIVTARKSNGFFLQTPDAEIDADPDSSEGIFVFTSSLPAVAVGDAVSVVGEVTEFFMLTEIGKGGAPATFAINSSGNSLPAAITFTTAILDPAGTPDQLERFEGMRMHADSLVSVAPTNEFGEISTVLPGVQRPLREPGIEVTLPVPPDPTSGVPDCCIPIWDRNPERIMIDTEGLVGASVISVTTDVTLSNVTGPLDFTFDDYKVLPETPPTRTANISAVPVPMPAACEFTVSGFNIENFNNNATQRHKAALAIRDVLRLPDIIGTIEIFELSGLQALANEIESISGVHYEARLIEADGISGDADQDVGFLVKTSRIQIDSVTQVEMLGCDGTDANCNTYIDPNTDQPALLNDRPPLVLRATVDPLSLDPHQIIVVVNHLRSFIDIELVAGDGPRVRAKRKAQGEFLANLLQDLQTNNPTTPIMSIGDYNAYQFNDGYTDPVATIKGMPTPDDQVVVDESPDLVNPNFINLTDGLPADQRYSFVFEGTPQAIDHFLLNTVATSLLQRYTVARNNSDFPDSFVSDSTRPERCSDHDMTLAYFRFPPKIAGVSVSTQTLWPANHKMVDVAVNYQVVSACPVICTLSVSSNEPLNGTGDGDTSPDWIVVDAHNVKLRAERAGTGNGRVYTITITCVDDAGNTSNQTVTVTVPLNQGH
jgi:predicted extracellular nuclease